MNFVSSDTTTITIKSILHLARQRLWPVTQQNATHASHCWRTIHHSPRQEILWHRTRCYVWLSRPILHLYALLFPSIWKLSARSTSCFYYWLLQETRPAACRVASVTWWKREKCPKSRGQQTCQIGNISQVILRVLVCVVYVYRNGTWALKLVEIILWPIARLSLVRGIINTLLGWHARCHVMYGVWTDVSGKHANLYSQLNKWNSTIPLKRYESGDAWVDWTRDNWAWGCVS